MKENNLKMYLLKKITRFLKLYVKHFSPVSEDREIGTDNLHRPDVVKDLAHEYQTSWRRILLLILAVTVHNIPEVVFKNDLFL